MKNRFYQRISYASTKKGDHNQTYGLIKLSRTVKIPIDTLANRLQGSLPAQRERQHVVIRTTSVQGHVRESVQALYPYMMGLGERQTEDDIMAVVQARVSPSKSNTTCIVYHTTQAN